MNYFRSIKCNLQLFESLLYQMLTALLYNTDVCDTSNKNLVSNKIRCFFKYLLLQSFSAEGVPISKYEK